MDVLAMIGPASADHGIHLHLPRELQLPGIDYVALLLAAMLTGLGISGPGEALLVAAGIAAAHHRLDLAGVVLTAWAGVTLGGLVGWIAGRHVGRPVMTAPGPLLRLRRRLVHSGERFYEKYHVLAIVFAPSPMAGIHRVGVRRFLLITVLWGLAWALGLGLGAYYAGPPVLDVVAHVGAAGLAVVIALAALYAVHLYRRHRRER